MDASHDVSQPPIDTLEPNHPVVTQLPYRSGRIRKAHSHSQDFICEQISSPFPSQKLNKQKEVNTIGSIFPLRDSISYDKLSTPHRAFIASITNHFELKNYQEATTFHEWCASMKAKIEALRLNDTRVQPQDVNGCLESNSMLSIALKGSTHVLWQKSTLNMRT